MTVPQRLYTISMPLRGEIVVGCAACASTSAFVIGQANVVDSDKQPALAANLHDYGFPTSACPNCGKRGLYLPLVLVDPGRRRTLLLLPENKLLVKPHAAAALDILRHACYQLDPTAPRQEVICRTDDAVSSALSTADPDDPTGGLQHLLVEDIYDPLNRYLNSFDFAETQALFQAYPELLDPAVDGLLAHSIAEMQATGQEQYVWALHSKRSTLASCREYGVAAVLEHGQAVQRRVNQLSPNARSIFAASLQGRQVLEQLAGQMPDFQSRFAQFEREMEQIGPMPDELLDQLHSALDAFLHAGSLVELEHLLSHRSALLAPRADAILSDMAERRDAAGDGVGVASVSTRLWLLRRSKEIGVQPALAELQAEVDKINPAFQELAHYLSEGRLSLSILDDRAARVRLLAEDPALFAKVEAVIRAVHRDVFEGRLDGDIPEELRWIAELPDEIRSIAADAFIGRLPDTARLEAENPALHYRLKQALAAIGEELPRPASTGPIDFSDASGAWLAAVWEDLQLMRQAIDRAQHGGDFSLLNQAGEAWLRARSHPQFQRADPETRGFISGAGLLYFVRYNAFGQREDMDRSIDAYAELAQIFAAGSQGRFEALMQQANLFVTRYQSGFGNNNDLEEAIRCGLDALACEAPDPIAPALVRSNLGMHYAQKYDHSKQPQDLDDSIAQLTQAVAALPVTSEHLARTLSQLGLGLVTRSRMSGSDTDLNQGVVNSRRACELAQKGDPFRASYEGNLALALSIRYKRFGALEDLDDQIGAYRRALAGFPAGSNYWAQAGHQLTNALRDRAMETRRIADLDEALKLLDRIERELTGDETMRAILLYGRGRALLAYHQLDRKAGWLNQAITTHQRAAALMPADSLYRSIAAGGYGHALLQRGNPADIDAAVDIARQILAQAGQNDEARAQAQSLLAQALRRRPQTLRDSQGVREVAESYAAAYELCRFHQPAAAMLLAREWGDWAAGREEWDEAVVAYTHALTQVERRYQGQLLRSSKERWLAEAGAIHAAAAYAQARAGDPMGAAVTLEHGRARELTAAMARDQSDLESLRERHPDLYVAYRSAATRLGDFESSEVSRAALIAQINLSSQPELSRARYAAADLEAVIAAIRKLPGFEQFLQPSTRADLDEAVLAGCPLVYLVAAPAGGLALLLSRPAAMLEAVAVPLPDLSGPAVEALVLTSPTSWLTVYARRYRRSPAARFGGSAGPAWAKAANAQDRWLELIDSTTHQLWNIALGPMLTQLSANIDKVIIIPVGLLALLPLHAAWQANVQGREYALDRLQIRYAPSARVLTSARRRLMPRTDRLILIEDPQPVHADPLPAVPYEVQAIKPHFLDPTIVSKSAATRRAALAALPEAQVAHFACHASADWEQPRRSGLLLANDEVLTVDDLVGLRIKSARLAVLSACETAMVGTSLPDEVISLPAAFMRAGFCGVIASLWVVPDLSTAILMERFYRLWRNGRLEPSEALRQAQMWVRDTTRKEKIAYYKQLENMDWAEQGPQSAFGASAAAIATLLEAHREGELDFSHPYFWSAFQYIGY